MQKCIYICLTEMTTPRNEDDQILDFFGKVIAIVADKANT
jgi:hypothetical protein